MIEKFHEKSKGFAFKAIFVAVTLSFVLGGIGGGILTVGGSDYVAKVNGDKIERHYFENIKINAQNNIARENSEQFFSLLEDPQFERSFNKQILENLINERLLSSYVEHLGLGVSSEQIKQAIVSDPQFHQDGRFSNEFYQSLLRNNNISADSYAQRVGQRVILEQLNQAIFDTDFIGKAQQEELARLLLAKRTFSVLELSLEDEMKSISLDDEKVKAYFDEHHDQFLTDQRLDVELVTISLDDFKNIKSTDEEIERFYQENIEQFRIKGKTLVSDIQLDNEHDADKVYQAVKKGEDFATLVGEYSTDPIGKLNKGELGEVGDLPLIFQNAVKDLTQGAVSAPFIFEGKYHIVKLDKVIDEVLKDLTEVREEIAQKLTHSKALGLYSAAINEMAHRAFESGEDIEQVAKVGIRAVERFEGISLNHLPSPLTQPRVVAMLNNQQLRSSHLISEAIDLTEGDQPKTAFIRISKVIEPELKNFDEVKDQIKERLVRTQAIENLNKRAEQMIDDLKAGKNTSPTFANTITLDYLQASSLGSVAEQLFAMNVANNQYQVVSLGSNIALVRLDAIEMSDKLLPKAVDEQLRTNLLQQGQQQLLENLRNDASIKYHGEFSE